MQLANFFPNFDKFAQKFPADCQVFFLTTNDEFFTFKVKKGTASVRIELILDKGAPVWHVVLSAKTEQVSIFETERLIQVVRDYFVADLKLQIYIAKRLRKSQGHVVD
jgi:hypothetical protein